MKFQFMFILFFFTIYVSSGQIANGDFDWWNNIHGWEPGDPGWRNWMKITPGYLGPNALPVPEVKKGIIGKGTEMEITFSNHFNTEDPTQDLSARFLIPFANNRIAIEMYGVVFEHFAFSKEIRDERYARDRDGKGNAVGDFYFSTLIQVIKDKKFPNTLFRFATKTASGNQLEAARYTDSPGYFTDLSFSREFNQKVSGTIRPFAMIGFYCWQTNDELNLQNDAFLYGLGIDYLKNNWLFSASCSGYSGYKDEHDKPMQLNFDMRKDLGKTALRFRYNYGLRDWKYKTIRISFIWKWERNEEFN